MLIFFSWNDKFRRVVGIEPNVLLSIFWVTIITFFLHECVIQIELLIWMPNILVYMGVQNFVIPLNTKFFDASIDCLTWLKPVSYGVPQQIAKLDMTLNNTSMVNE